jgi:hypothetical protein
LIDVIGMLTNEMHISFDELSASLTTELGPKVIMSFALSRSKVVAGEGRCLEESLDVLAQCCGVSRRELRMMFGVAEGMLIQIVRSLPICGLVQALAFAGETVLREGPMKKKEICKALPLLCQYQHAAESALRSDGTAWVRTDALVIAQLENARFETLTDGDVFGPDFRRKYGGRALVVMKANAASFPQGKIVYTMADVGLCRYAAGEKEVRHALRIFDIARVRTKKGMGVFSWRWGEEFKEFAVMANSHPNARFMFFERGLLKEMELFGVVRESPSQPIEFKREATVWRGEPVWPRFEDGAWDAGDGAAEEPAPSPVTLVMTFEAVEGGVLEFEGPATEEGVVPTV